MGNCVPWKRERKWPTNPTGFSLPDGTNETGRSLQSSSGGRWEFLVFLGSSGPAESASSSQGASAAVPESLVSCGEEPVLLKIENGTPWPWQVLGPVLSPGVEKFTLKQILIVKFSFVCCYCCLLGELPQAAPEGKKKNKRKQKGSLHLHCFSSLQARMKGKEQEPEGKRGSHEQPWLSKGHSNPLAPWFHLQPQGQ